MGLDSRRETRFPGGNITAKPKIREKRANVNRQTRFPGGSDPQKIFLLEAEELPFEAKPKEAAHTLSRLPLKINPPDAIPERPPPIMSISITKEDLIPPVITESPWKKYKPLRPLERGGQVTAACTRIVPVKMVAVKQVSDDLRKLGNCQHENLLAVIEMYQCEGAFFVITDYTVATLKQIIAIRLPLEEIHISTTCRQGSPIATPGY